MIKSFFTFLKAKINSWLDWEFSNPINRVLCKCMDNLKNSLCRKPDV